jgi:hypothetical protein
MVESMRSSRATFGSLLAGLSAIVLGLDTWQPWYALRLPSVFLDQLDALSGNLGSFGGYLRSGVDYARTAGPIPLSAHDVFHAIDVELVLIGVAVVGILLTGLSRGRPVFAAGDGGAVAGLGGMAFCLVGYRILFPPGPAELLSLRPGIWIGLVAAGGICAGGLLSREPPEVARTQAVAPAPPAGLSW